MLQEVAGRGAAKVSDILSGPLLPSSTFLEGARRGYEGLLELLSADTALLDDRLLNPLAVSLHRSLMAAGSLVRCLAELLFYSTVMTLKLLVLVFPHLIRLFDVIVEFHRTQLTVWDMLVEGFILSFMLLFFTFRVRIAAFWARLQRRLDKRYRVAARYAPHVAFFLVASVFAVAGRKILLPVCASPAMPLLFISYPCYQTLRRIGDTSTAQYADSLKYWIVVSLYFATNRLLCLIPFSSFLFQHVYVIRVMVLIVAVWIQVSSTCVDIVFDAVAPILEYYVEKIPAADFGSQYGAAVLNGLMFARIISAKTAEVLQNLMGDTISVLLCAVFSFTPTYMATFGVVAVVMILPAFKTSKLLKKLRVATKIQEHPDLIEAQTQWMKYWCCFATSIAFECCGVVLWCSVSMVLFSWLQHSYFIGASKVFAYAMKEAAAISARHRKVAEQKEAENVQQVEVKRPQKAKHFETAKLEDNSSEKGLKLENVQSPPSTACEDITTPISSGGPGPHVEENESKENSSSLRKRAKTKRNDD